MSKIKLRKSLGYVLMLVAFAIPVYCFGQMVLQSLEQVKGHKTFSASVTTKSYQEQLQKSLDYNEQLDSQNHIVDPFLAEGYEVNYRVSDNPDAVYGYLSIPSLEVMEPVYLGADYHHLGIGLAHVDGTPLPVEGKGIRSVIAGHRAEPSHVFFRHLDQLKAGDVLYYDNGQEIVEYRMTDTEIILPSEWEKLASSSTKNIMTLITCDPIPAFNKRLLVNFERIGVYQKSDKTTAPVLKKAFTKQGQSVSRVSGTQWFYRGVVMVSILGFMIVLWKLVRFLIAQ
ncbi:sortase [Streptococcus hillyeri]|uniref:Sortase n=1 Tax=Streptococcus hillyeri TaxID=2282420 RepID=A0A3L9DWR2_9STRE|nr:sortase [Streptococcus hillyeri]RLY03622.1 sortase [Streptococcus hillyeri]